MLLEHLHPVRRESAEVSRKKLAGAPSDVMTARFLQALFSWRPKDPGTTLPAGKPAAGSLVGPLRRRSNKICWHATGLLGAADEEAIIRTVTESLESHFKEPGEDLFTVCIYMVGISRETALPTIVIITRGSAFREEVRKVMEEDDILHAYPGFGAAYVSKQPGADKMETLATGKTPGSEPSQRTTKLATEVLYDKSKPITPMGLPIYVRRSNCFRPATANAVHIGSQCYLQTVQHAFIEGVSSEIDDSDTDSDSEYDSDYDQEADVAITSIGSQSPDTFSEIDSPDSQGSRRSSSSSGASTPPTATVLPEYHPSIATFNDNTSQIAAVHAKLAPSAQTPFTGKGPIEPPEECLSHLGWHIKSSAKDDIALIVVMSQHVKDALKETSCLLSELGISQALAYDTIAQHPKDNSKVVTYTASGGEIYGTLAGTSSYTRLPNGHSFRKVYIARLNGSLARGDCGSVVIDATTGHTYGHLVAGCRTTGTAYILTSEQVVEDFFEISRTISSAETSLLDSLISYIFQPLDWISPQSRLVLPVLLVLLFVYVIFFWALMLIYCLVEVCRKLKRGPGSTARDMDIAILRSSDISLDSPFQAPPLAERIEKPLGDRAHIRAVFGTKANMYAWLGVTLCSNLPLLEYFDFPRPIAKWLAMSETRSFMVAYGIPLFVPLAMSLASWLRFYSRGKLLTDTITTSPTISSLTLQLLGGFHFANLLSRFDMFQENGYLSWSKLLPISIFLPSFVEALFIRKYQGLIVLFPALKMYVAVWMLCLLPDRGPPEPLGFHALILSLYLLWLTFITLIAMFIRIRNKPDPDVGIWKTSAISTLVYGLPDDMQKKIQSSKENGTPRAKAKEIEVKLLPKQGWRVSGNPALPRKGRKFADDDASEAPPNWI